MPVVISPESEYGKALAEWNKRPIGHPLEFPKMLYQAHRRPDGILSVCESEDSTFADARGNVQAGASEAFNKKCQRTVQSEAEMHEALERGWRLTPKEAMEFAESRDRTVSDYAAHRAYEDRNMSEAAQAEIKAAEEATEFHVPEIPEKPKKRRGRPPKNAAA